MYVTRKKTSYCYSEEERINAINELGPNPEITRFKGLGEISPDEFKHFIGKDMRLEQVTLRKTDAVKELLEFYMGKEYYGTTKLYYRQSGYRRRLGIMRKAIFRVLSTLSPSDIIR